MLPEEQVRQWMLSVLVDFGVDRSRIAVEHSIAVGQRRLRIDIAIFKQRSTQIIAIVECKAPSVTISESTFNQAAVYNSVVGARYLIATNGASTFIYDTVLKSFIDSLPCDL